MAAMKRAALLAAFLLCACSPQRPEVAAKVNGKPIPLEEFRLALAQADLAGGRSPAPSGLLDRMINRELLAQKAEPLKLDRVPGAKDCGRVLAITDHLIRESRVALLAGRTP
jgi:hypothetical protein